MWHAILINVTNTVLQIKYTNGTRSFLETTSLDDVENMNKTDFLAFVQAKIDALNTQDATRTTFITKISQYIGQQIL